jgi:hypothetical protein
LQDGANDQSPPSTSDDHDVGYFGVHDLRHGAFLGCVQMI